MTGYKDPPVETRFSSTYQPLTKNGRKKSVLDHMKELAGDEFKVELSTNDQFRIIQSLIERNQEELEHIDNNPDAPWFMRMVVTALLEDYKKKTISTLETIYNRVNGKPKESVSNTITGDFDFKVVFDRPKKREPLLTKDVPSDDSSKI